MPQQETLLKLATLTSKDGGKDTEKGDSNMHKKRETKRTWKHLERLKKI